MVENVVIESLAAQQEKIEQWFQKKWTDAPPIYASMDIRESHFKITPIDTNLFPAGFNNLSIHDQCIIKTNLQHVLKQFFPNCSRLLIITENHTRNSHYFSSIAALQQWIKQLGIEVRLSNFVGENYTVGTQTNENITIEKLERFDQYLKLGTFVPDYILLNNDLSEGIPALLRNIKQNIVPYPNLGWHQRLKSNYFAYYQKVACSFALDFQWDPWHFYPLYQVHTHIDFSTREGRQLLVPKVEQLLVAIQEKYRQYAIQDDPYVVIKADNGSYGMAVMTISSVDELVNLSRQKRSHMQRTKGNQPVQSVIIQEGIFATTTWMHQVAEPVLYTFGKEVVGGFYRTHLKRSAKENLNTPGMTLIPMDIASKLLKKTASVQNSEWKRLYAYSVVARLGLLAAAAETKAVFNQSTLV